MQVGRLKRVLVRSWFEWRRKGLRERIFREYGSSSDSEVKEVLEFLRANPGLQLPLGMRPPYSWVQDYMSSKSKVNRDPDNRMLYVESTGHRVYFPRNLTPAQVQEMVRLAQMEQDPRSPHCYVANGFGPDPGDVGIFIGASDGIFCLSIFDQLSKAILFEPNQGWLEPLQATFRDLLGKVQIVPLALGSKDADGVIKLDSFLRNGPEPNYIQMDVDCAEWDVLQSARETLVNARKLKLSICTYHKRRDYARFSKFFQRHGYWTGHSPGFYLIGVRMPYLRRGVLYAARGVHIKNAA